MGSEVALSGGPSANLQQSFHLALGFENSNVLPLQVPDPFLVSIFACHDVSV